MAHFAELDDNNIVKRIVVVNNTELIDNGKEKESKGIEFCKNLFGGNWIQTSYNAKIRKNFAGIGFTYDKNKDIFIAPKPYTSWILDQNAQWQAPAPMPSDGAMYGWDETTTSWVEVGI